MKIQIYLRYITRPARVHIFALISHQETALKSIKSTAEVDTNPVRIYRNYLSFQGWSQKVFPAITISILSPHILLYLVLDGYNFEEDRIQLIIWEKKRETHILSVDFIVLHQWNGCHLFWINPQKHRFLEMQISEVNI